MIAGVELVLDHSDANLLDQLVRIWKSKRPRNLERSVYFDGKAALKDFGISLPPQMRSIGSTLGWTAKGVRALTDRSKLLGFESATDSDDPFGVSTIAWENNFSLKFPAAQVSSAVHGCSFIAVSNGDTQSGEPDVLAVPRAADTSAALWDYRRDALKAFLSVTEITPMGQIERMVMYLPEKVVTLTRQGDAWSSKWKVDLQRNPLGIVPVAPLAHGYDLTKPLGHSRITPASMKYVDSAIRTITRAEVSAEFYSAPEYFLFGADVTDFIGDDKWSAVMGRFKALDVEQGDDKPDLHRFSGSSPQPHTDQLRMWASLFADDQDLDVKFADNSNPSSAEAIYAAKESLITSTGAANNVWGWGAVKAMQMAVMLREGLTSVPAEMRSLSARFTPPEIVSPSGRADAFSKLTAGIDGFGSTRVGQEYAGLDRGQIDRLQEEMKQKQVSTLLSAIQGAASAATKDPDIATLAASRGNAE